jgi:hypothetical protein
MKYLIHNVELEELKKIQQDFNTGIASINGCPVIYVRYWHSSEKKGTYHVIQEYDPSTSKPATITMRCSTPMDLQNIRKALKNFKDNNEYTFRGETNIQKVILDCRKDNKVGFVVIEKNHFHMGVEKIILQFLPYPFQLPGNSISNCTIFSSVINDLPIELLSRAIKYLKEAQKIWEEFPEKLSKEIRKANQKADKAGIKRQTVKVKVF